jgi:hypothetical protein
MAGMIGTLEEGENGNPANYWVLQDLEELQDESEEGAVILKKGDFYIGDNDNFISLTHNDKGKSSLSLKADHINISAEGTEVVGDLTVTGILNPSALIIPVYNSNPNNPAEGQVWILRSS